MLYGRTSAHTSRVRALPMVIALLGAALGPIAFSADRVYFDISSGPAQEGLLQFAMQAHLDLLLDPRATDRLHTQAVRGDFAIEEALSRLLTHTGIDAQLDLTGSRLIIAQHRNPTAPAQDHPRFSQTTPVASATTAKNALSAESAIEEVSITGSNIRNAQPVGGELITIGRQEILNSGATSLGDLIQRLAPVFRGGPSQTGRGSDVESRSNSGLGEGINLRGLGARASLILIDGVRPAPSGNAAAFVDVLNIPITALDRIEIFLDGASALYGADAVGGVVNFITLHGDAPTQTLLQGGGVTEGSLRRARLGQVLNAHWPSGNLVLACELNDQSALDSIDRPYLASDSPYSNPGTLVVDGIPYAIPRGSTGTAPRASPIPATYNLTDSAQDTQIIPSQIWESVLGKLRQGFGSSSQVTLQVLFTHRRATQTNGGVQVALTVPPTNPYYFNPRGGTAPVTVDYDFAADLGPRTTQVDVWTSLSTLQIEHALNAHSVLSLSLSHALETEAQRIHGEVNDRALAEALATSEPSLALNVFGDGSHTSASTLGSIERIPWYNSLSTYDTLALKLDDELVFGPAGPLKAAVGAEVRAQRFDTKNSDGVAPATLTRFRRSMLATFGQLDIPIWSDRLAAQGLDLSLAARFERYSDSIHSTIPSVGLSWRPIPQIHLTAKYSRSFRLPDAGDLGTSQNATFLAVLPDKSAPSGMSTVVLASGGNPSLKEERAISRSLGLSLATSGPDDLHSSIAVNYFDDQLLDRIQSPVLASVNLATMLNDPAWQDFVVRAPSPSLRNQICSSWLVSTGDRMQCMTATTILDLRLRNIQSLEVRGLDLDTMIAWNSPWAALQWSLRGTYLLAYDAVNTPESPRVSLLNRIGEPVDLTFQSTFSASRGGVSAAATFNYTNHYRNTLLDPSVPISSWTTVDLQLAYGWDGHSELGRAKAWELGVIALNAFDRAPPVALDPTSRTAYDSSNATAWGRVLSLYGKVRW
jgi:iron complex outermembrane receptor protein